MRQPNTYTSISSKNIHPTYDPVFLKTPKILKIKFEMPDFVVRSS